MAVCVPCMQLVYVQSCEMSFCHSSGAGSKVDSGDSKKQNDDLSIPAAIAVSVVVIILLATLIVVLVVIVCYCKKCRRSKQYGVHTQSASSSSPPSYHSSKGSLDGPVIATPDLSRKAKVAMELKPLEFGAPFSEDDGEMIPSGAIPVNMFREHVEKFDENRQLLFQHEFDVSDVVITSLSIYWAVVTCPHSIPQWIQANAPTCPSDASNLPINDEKNRYSNITACELWYLLVHLV